MTESKTFIDTLRRPRTWLVLVGVAIIAAVIVAAFNPPSKTEMDQALAPWDPVAARSLALDHSDVPAWYREAAGEAAAKGEMFTWTWMGCRIVRTPAGDLYRASVDAPESALSKVEGRVPAGSCDPAATSSSVEAPAR